MRDLEKKEQELKLHMDHLVESGNNASKALGYFEAYSSLFALHPKYNVDTFVELYRTNVQTVEIALPIVQADLEAVRAEIGRLRSL
ncbi:MAG: hypothetical protein H0U59_04495 [Gemmatimonadaceae bacterium]|nr:hypothetical protein [Gemmatimonadaceae bacterium]